MALLLLIAVIFNGLPTKQQTTWHHWRCSFWLLLFSIGYPQNNKPLDTIGVALVDCCYFQWAIHKTTNHLTPLALLLLIVVIFNKLPTKQQTSWHLWRCSCWLLLFSIGYPQNNKPLDTIGVALVDCCYFQWATHKTTNHLTPLALLLLIVVIFNKLPTKQQTSWHHWRCSCWLLLFSIGYPQNNKPLDTIGVALVDCCYFQWATHKTTNHLTPLALLLLIVVIFNKLPTKQQTSWHHWRCSCWLLLFSMGYPQNNKPLDTIGVALVDCCYFQWATHKTTNHLTPLALLLLIVVIFNKLPTKQQTTWHHWRCPCWLLLFSMGYPQNNKPLDTIGVALVDCCYFQ